MKTLIVQIHRRSFTTSVTDGAERELRYLGQDSQQEPGVGDHLFDSARVSGHDGHDVRDEMSDSGEREREGRECKLEKEKRGKERNEKVVKEKR